MKSLQKEQIFFKDISKIVIDFVSKKKDASIVKHKRDSDFSTVVDVGVENLIVREIKKRFPHDLILAEEGFTDTQIPEGRIWIIDPICGTNNLARGIKNFCTNIALADKKKLIASCVIDHSHNDYFWSIGGKKVYINGTLLKLKQKRYDTVVDVDFGAVTSVDKKLKERHNKFLPYFSQLLAPFCVYCHW